MMRKDQARSLPRSIFLYFLRVFEARKTQDAHSRRRRRYALPIFSQSSYFSSFPLTPTHENTLLRDACAHEMQMKDAGAQARKIPTQTQVFITGFLLPFLLFFPHTNDEHMRPCAQETHMKCKERKRKDPQRLARSLPRSTLSLSVFSLHHIHTQRQPGDFSLP